MQTETLLKKSKACPRQDREVEDFVDFLAERAERRLVQTATKMSEEAFYKVWDNEKMPLRPFIVSATWCLSVPIYRSIGREKASGGSRQFRRLQRRASRSRPDGDYRSIKRHGECRGDRSHRVAESGTTEGIFHHARTYNHRKEIGVAQTRTARSTRP